jgi:hypothetical protein
MYPTSPTAQRHVMIRAVRDTLKGGARRKLAIILSSLVPRRTGLIGTLTVPFEARDKAEKYQSNP